MPVARPRPPINCSKVLLVEGSDEVNYLSELLKYLVLDPTTDVQPIEVDGKYNFRNEFPAFLKDSKFPQVTAYAIMRDADDSFELTLKSIQGLLNDNSQPCPRNMGNLLVMDIAK